MQHKSKHFWELVEIAAKQCRTERNGGTVKFFPHDKTKGIFISHASDSGFHPLRRYLKNQLKISI